MPQVLKPSNDEFDPEELDVEWEDTQFDTYDGEQPPSGTALVVNIKKLWWTYASDDTAMLKVLMQAEGNNGGKEEYEGLPIWENLTFKSSAAFKYGPFLEVAGFTLQDIKKKMKVADEDDRNGAPIVSVGSFKPDSDDSFIGVVTKRERYNGKWQVRASKYLAADDIEEMDDPEPEEEEDERPTKAQGTKAARGSTGTKSGAPAKRSRAKPEPDDDEEAEEEESAPARGRSRRTTTTKTGAGKAKARTARRGTQRAKDDDDEPPF